MAAAILLASIMISLALLLAHSGAFLSAASCNFSSSCTDMSYDSGYLYAECMNWKGYRLKTRIYLNNAVANVGGKLVCSYITGGGFMSSCSDITVSGSSLTALCTDSDGDAVSTSLDLDSCIANDNASLQWCWSDNPITNM